MRITVTVYVKIPRSAMVDASRIRLNANKISLRLFESEGRIPSRSVCLYEVKGRHRGQQGNVHKYCGVFFDCDVFG